MGPSHDISIKEVAELLLDSTPVGSPVVHEHVELDDGESLFHVEVTVDELIGRGFRIVGRLYDEVFYQGSCALRIWRVGLPDGQIVYLRLDNMGGRMFCRRLELHAVDASGNRAIWPGASKLTPKDKQFWEIIRHVNGGRRIQGIGQPSR